MDEEIDVDDALDRAGFDPNESVLTRRQAIVLVLREQGLTQAAIAGRLGTSRPNVANLEASARANVRKARETVAFVEALAAPVQVTVRAGTDIYDVPNAVYAAADEADVTVGHPAPDLLRRVADVAGEAIEDRVVTTRILVTVSRSGDVTVRCQSVDGEAPTGSDPPRR